MTGKKEPLWLAVRVKRRVEEHDTKTPTRTRMGKNVVPIKGAM